MYYKQGDSVIVELNSGEIFDGVVYSATDTILSLNPIYEFPTNKEINYLCNFRKSNIKYVKNIRLLTQNDNPSDKCIFISSGDYKVFMNVIASYKIFNEISKDFLKAIKFLETYETIGIDAKGAKRGRFNNISYMIFATYNSVYVFNIKKIGKIAFDGGLKQILECNNITKIVYDSRVLKDCLKHCYDVDLNNIYDVKVADYIIQSQNESKQLESLRDCVQYYLNLPKNIVDNIKCIQWEQESLPKSIEEVIAVQACILLFLHQLIQRRMRYQLDTITKRHYSDQIPQGQKYFPSSLFTRAYQRYGISLNMDC